MKDFLLDTLCAKSVSPGIHFLSSGAQSRKQGDKTEYKDKGKSPVVTIIEFKDLNAEFEVCTNNSSNGVNVASSSVFTAGHNFINNTNDFSAAGPSNAAMPNVEDLTHFNDTDDVGAEADINNLESIISTRSMARVVRDQAYSDSDYAGACLDRKSTTRGCQFLGCRLISWQCKKQTVVATSSTEAEYVVAASGCAQVMWIQNQLLDYRSTY
nr:putative ribonuclease H-like domain-containing protein [Tanacetum cinerariifolium]